MTEETPTTLIERVRADAAQRREDAASLYRGILLRQDAPHDGDIKKLAGAMAVLGRTADNLSDDLAVVHSLAALDVAEQAERELSEPYKIALRAAKEVQAREEDKLAKAQERCGVAIRDAQQEASQLLGSLNAAGAARDQHWAARNAWEVIATGLTLDEVRARRSAAT